MRHSEFVHSTKKIAEFTVQLRHCVPNPSHKTRKSKHYDWNEKNWRWIEYWHVPNARLSELMRTDAFVDIGACLFPDRWLTDVLNSLGVLCQSPVCFVCVCVCASHILSFQTGSGLKLTGSLPYSMGSPSDSKGHCATGVWFLQPVLFFFPSVRYF